MNKKFRLNVSLDARDRTILDDLEDALTGVMGAIQQISDRQARVVAGVIMGHLGGAATVGGVTGLIATLGTASTGTAIGSLSGAAATSAKLYWVGALVGGGVAAGTILLTLSGAGAALLVGIYGKRKLFGQPRKSDDLPANEMAILLAVITLRNSVCEDIEASRIPTFDEMALVSHEVILPLIQRLNYKCERLDGGSPARFEETLNWYHYRRLRRHQGGLQKIASKYLEPAK